MKHRSVSSIVLLVLLLAAIATPAASVDDSSIVGFRGDLSRSGVTADPGPGEFVRVLWELRVGGPVRSSPLLAAGVLYFGSADGGLYAVDADSGATLWRFDAGVPIVSGVAADAERVYFLDRHNTIHALDRDSGARAWRRETGGDRPLPWGLEGWDYFTSTPLVVDDVLLAASGDGVLYALEAETGRERWAHDAGARLRSSPAFADGRVYLGDGAGIVHAIHFADGVPVWAFTTDGHDLDASGGFDRRQIYPSAAVVDGVVYIGSRDRHDYAIDAATGELRWKSDDGTSGWVISSPAVADGRVYSARSSSAMVQALDVSDGSEIWRHQAAGPVFASPIRAADLLYVADGAGFVQALDPATGEQRWRYRPGGPIQATPVVSGDRMYVAGDDGSVVALGPGAPVHLGVFHDPEMRAVTVLGARPTHDTIVDFFAQHGYGRLDAAAIETFLRERVADREPSVVVFAMDALPAALAPAEGGPGLLRRYLDAGGKVVWLGHAPLLLPRDEQGNVVAVDRDTPSRVLGVDLGGYNTDVYGARITTAGRTMGLRTWWQGKPWSGAAADVGAVLAHDDLGQPMAFARSYGGPEGTGFVALYPAMTGDRLDEVRRVAEYGILRSPSAARVDSHSADDPGPRP